MPTIHTAILGAMFANYTNIVLQINFDEKNFEFNLLRNIRIEGKYYMKFEEIELVENSKPLLVCFIF